MAWLDCIWFLKYCENHSQDIVTALVLICIAFASNFFNYAVAEGGMSQVYSFFLFALFLHLSIRYFINPRWKTYLLVGLVFGLIVLIRPTNSIVIIPVFLWGVYGKSAFNERFDLLRKKLPHLIPFIMAMLIIIAPQLYYWKTMTGSWIYYSYQNEGFNFLQPEILNGLLSYRKGWLVYSPVMLFSIAGLFLLFNRKYRSFLLPVLSFFIINLYIVFSWETWWYGGGFGARALVESYVFLAFPMAVFINYVLKRSLIIWVLLLLAVAFFIAVNLLQTYQYAKGIFHRDSMTKKAYWHIFAEPNADVPERMFSPPSKK
ncbi:MAG: glycosyltransferase family 39 protein [Bacteroidales bacterium]|nr:glycosyltransferase family 39 protein [Bacteroidales bacterium]MCF8344928.1 glycosyltransferase family 39 protein [Bacteroidales bacterium]MCF8349950.1 glycosyltransferase family 39 protein [Bacteroidales bacterium]MCF8375468.1 glycosyltransferase family 39 protein [Bacteroidales bacterium]MCF8402117.1 glycosyltransferase family 39 protein [Bacteroidales bacterium]